MLSVICIIASAPLMLLYRSLKVKYICGKISGILLRSGLLVVVAGFEPGMGEGDV